MYKLICHSTQRKEKVATINQSIILADYNESLLKFVIKSLEQ